MATMATVSCGSPITPASIAAVASTSTMKSEN